jgi:hypothetical protein
MTTKITYRCPSCGSEDVTADAAARWCDEAQKWEASDTHDSLTCQTCGAEGHTSAWETPLDYEPDLRSGVRRAGSLVELRDMLNAWLDAQDKRDPARRVRIEDACEIDNLPVYGDPENRITCTFEIWSWDDEHKLVLNNATNRYVIKPRED